MKVNHLRRVGGYMTRSNMDQGGRTATQGCGKMESGEVRLCAV